MAEETIKATIQSIQPKIWDPLFSSVKNNRVGQAYLFTGPEGSGKEYMAMEFARLMNCDHPGQGSCGSCRSCLRFDSLQHEHLYFIVPMPVNKQKNDDDFGADIDVLSEEIQKKAKDPYHKIKLPKANRILIKSIRALRKKLYFKSLESGRKVVFIFDAHLLTSGQGEAANALLKILEEPPNNTTLILVTDHKSKLYATILSRCQQFNFPPLGKETISEILANAGVSEEHAKFVSSLSQGNIHQARLLSKMEPDDLKKLLLGLVKTFEDQSPDRIRNFVSTLGRAGFSNNEQYRFSLTLLQLWFKSTNASRIQSHDDLYNAGFGQMMDAFNRQFPRANFLQINKELEYAASAPERNQYLPLVLITTVIKISKALNNEFHALT